MVFTCSTYLGGLSGGAEVESFPSAFQLPTEVHIVESWESPDAFPRTRGNTTRNITAYTDADSIELFVRGGVRHK